MADAKANKTDDGSGQKSGQVARVKGSEVFVGGLARTVTEKMLRELFSSCGEIVEIRMMKDQNGGFKGYCFVRFSTKEAALKAQKEKNKMIFQGKKIGVASSSDRDMLFLGNLRKDWLPEEVDSMVRQAFQEVASVDLAMPLSTGESNPDKKKHNRGFAFVRFSSHGAAARAHRVGSKQDFLLGGKWHPIVDWAESELEADPAELAKVKIAFVSNLPNNANEDFLRKLFEPFGKLERVAISRKSNVPVGFVHFLTRAELDNAIKALDGKNIDGPDKGPKFKIQVTVAKPAEKAKKRNREDTQNVGNNKPAVKGKPSLDVAGHTLDYFNLHAKVPRLDTKPAMEAVADPYELAVLSLPASVTDCLLRIFRQGLATRYDIDLACLETLRPLPEITAVSILEQFASANFADGRDKRAYLAGLITRAGQERNPRLSFLQQTRSSELPTREAGLLGVPGSSHSSLIDPLVASHSLTGSSLIRRDPYGTATSLLGHSQVPPLVKADPILERFSTGLDDTYGLSSYRNPTSAGVSFGTSLPEVNGTERRPPVKFDPFTGLPYKFDPFTGEPIQQPGSVPSSRFAGKYY
ncbi:uncharacterized protein LOC131028731 [Cryptomeria japonica]|uniref:uncharacterized protein LOC131028731 n=1 Tax=Cryptomeria japonica TaxID=3369 RepID=UPI0025ABACA3|nr:uncharacterized protein LOC131028731 [Cryptomeria japonica]